MSHLACDEDFTEMLVDEVHPAHEPFDTARKAVSQLATIASQFHLYCQQFAREGDPHTSEGYDPQQVQITAEEVRRTLLKVPASQWQYLIEPLTQNFEARSRTAEGLGAAPALTYR